MTRLFWLLGGLSTAAAIAGCSVYGNNLVGTGGSGGAGGASSTTGTGTTTTAPAGSGGAMACTSPSQCPAKATECQQPTCEGGFCGVMYAAMGTALASQKAGDCQKVVCDGQGNTTSQADDTDEPDDGNDCTDNTCAGGVPTFPAKMPGAPCNQNGGTLCTGSKKCVECLSASDCTSGVCSAANQCVTAQCNDHVKNGGETDVDCGGGTCPTCGFGKGCAKDSDCVSMQCAGGACAASCTDGAKDGAETDVDCGGPTCDKCASNKACTADGDCASGKCTNGACADVLLISQVQTRGDNGGNDEFVEIYNPTGVAVTFDATWVVKARSTSLTPCTSNSLAQRFAGTGQVIPPHRHLLYVNNMVPPYNGLTPSDGTYSTGIPDAASVVLLHGNTVVDALCFYFDTASQTALTTCSAAYICEGTPVMNPHNNMSSSNTDASLERLPGGAMGNAQDTGDSAADFKANSASDPHDLASAPVP